MARAERLIRYEQRTSAAMLALAMLYLLLYATEVLTPELPGWAELLITWVSNIIWAVFVADLLLRFVIAPNRFQYLLRHPVDVVAVIVPMFRFLRVLRVITAGQWLVSRGKRLAVGRTAAALFVAVGFLALVGGLAVLDAERGAAGANILDFGDAVWWAFTTMSTVGYGDVYPVTAAGRAVAVGMMTVGVSLLGVVSATMAAGFLAQIQGGRDDGTGALLRKIEELDARVEDLARQLREPGPASQQSASTTTE